MPASLTLFIWKNVNKEQFQPLFSVKPAKDLVIKIPHYINAGCNKRLEMFYMHDY